MGFVENLVIATILVSAVAIFVFIFLFLRFKEQKERKLAGFEETSSHEVSERWPFKVELSVSREEVDKAREELRMLELEREILSNAIRRLYEAHAEGKITEEERDRLAAHYKERMFNVKEAIEKNQSIVALHELEALQKDLIKLFNERFDELNRKIEELRTRLQIEPIKEITPIPIPAPPAPKVKAEKAPSKPTKGKVRRPRRKREEPKKSEAERRIEQIKAEIEKVLARLGQMEVEA